MRVYTSISSWLALIYPHLVHLRFSHTSFSFSCLSSTTALPYLIIKLRIHQAYHWQWQDRPYGMKISSIPRGYRHYSPDTYGSKFTPCVIDGVLLNFMTFQLQLHKERRVLVILKDKLDSPKVHKVVPQVSTTRHRIMSLRNDGHYYSSPH